MKNIKKILKFVSLSILFSSLSLTVISAQTAGEENLEYTKVGILKEETEQDNRTELVPFLIESVERPEVWPGVDIKLERPEVWPNVESENCDNLLKQRSINFKKLNRLYDELEKYKDYDPSPSDDWYFDEVEKIIMKIEDSEETLGELEAKIDELGCSVERPEVWPGIEVKPERPEVWPGIEVKPERPEVWPGIEVKPERPEVWPGIEVKPERPEVWPGIEVKPERPEVWPGIEVKPDNPSEHPKEDVKPENPNEYPKDEVKEDKGIIDNSKDLKKDQLDNNEKPEYQTPNTGVNSKYSAYIFVFFLGGLSTIILKMDYDE